jgi:hypothetical protein
MGKPLVIKIYHIVTTDRNISVEDLSQLAALPSQFIMDNAFFYGEYEIVGNLPLADGDMDFPIMYGGSIAVGDDRLLLQVGRHYHELDGRRHVLYTGFRNSAIGWCADIKLPVLRRCIGCHSNEPYWNQDNYSTNEDLRNPRFSTELDAVCCQFGLTKSDILLRTQV